MTKEKERAEDIVKMAGYPADWIGESTFTVFGLNALLLKLEKDPNKLVRETKGFRQYLGGYILGFSIKSGCGTRDFIEGLPHNKKYIDPFLLARRLEITPDLLPATIGGERLKSQPLIERVIDDEIIVHKIHVRSLAYLTFPAVVIPDFAKLSMQEIALKGRYNGDESYYREFERKARLRIGAAIAKCFPEALNAVVLMQAAMKGVKEAYMTYDFTKAFPIEDYIRGRAICTIIDSSKENDRRSQEENLTCKVKTLLTAFDNKISADAMELLMPTEPRKEVRRIYSHLRR